MSSWRADAISLAARLTMAPMTVYSRRSREPTTPQNAVPVAMPTETWDCGPRSCTLSTSSFPVDTARRASSGCDMGGKPMPMCGPARVGRGRMREGARE